MELKELNGHGQDKYKYKYKYNLTEWLKVRTRHLCSTALQNGKGATRTSAAMLTAADIIVGRHCHCHHHHQNTNTNTVQQYKYSAAMPTAADIIVSGQSSSSS